MSIGSVLGEIGSGLEKGAKAAGAVARPVFERVAQVESGEAPQIDAAARQRQTAMEDAQINAKAQELNSQLEMGRKYGTLTPEQQSQYVDQISQLYSHPRHADNLMAALRKVIHPNGATMTPATPQLKSAIPAGGTAAADERNKLTSLGLTEDAQNQQVLKNIEWYKQNIMPLLPPDQAAQKLNEYIDHLNGTVRGIEHPPKGMKAMEQGGVAFGIEDQDTGKQYLPQQLEPGGTAPPEAKSIWQSIQRAAADKQKAADAKVKEQEKLQNEREDRADERMRMAQAHSDRKTDRAIENAITIGDYRTAKKEIQKVEEAYQGSLDRVDTMEKSLTSALQGDQQAMTNLLANHIAMTKQQLGAPNRSPTRADFEEAMGSLPASDKLLKQFDANHGLLSGVTLSADQMHQMVKLGHEKVETLKEHLDRVKADNEDVLNPTDDEGKPIKKPKPGALKTLTQPPGGASAKPPNATHTVQYKGKTYWTDNQGNNLGEKKP